MANVSRQASAEIGVSMSVCSTGSQIARSCVNDSAFMAEDNWSAELAARMFKAMVAQAVSEGTLAISEDSQQCLPSHSPCLVSDPHSVQTTETVETDG